MGYEIPKTEGEESLEGLTVVKRATPTEPYEYVFANAVNNAMKMLDAPFYMVCQTQKKGRGKNQKIRRIIRWRKKGETCDLRYPNITSVSENTVRKWLLKNLKVSLFQLKKSPKSYAEKTIDRIKNTPKELTKAEKLAVKKQEREAKKLQRKSEIEARKAKRKADLEARKAAHKSKAKPTREKKAEQPKPEPKPEKKPFARAKQSPSGEMIVDYERENRSWLRKHYAQGKKSGEVARGTSYDEFVQHHYNDSKQPKPAAPEPAISEREQRGRDAIAMMKKFMEED